jgi:hypothetical protein
VPERIAALDSQVAARLNERGENRSNRRRSRNRLAIRPATRCGGLAAASFELADEAQAANQRIPCRHGGGAPGLVQYTDAGCWYPLIRNTDTSPRPAPSPRSAASVTPLRGEIGMIPPANSEATYYRQTLTLEIPGSP